MEHVSGVDPTSLWLAQPGDRVVTVDGPGSVAQVFDGPYPQTEAYHVVLDNELGGGEYGRADILALIEERTARRYSDVPMACDRCGTPASVSRGGGKGGHRMLCRPCADAEDGAKESILRSAARQPLPLVSEEDAVQLGLAVASMDYPELGSILWDRPDLVEAEPSTGMGRRITIGSLRTAKPIEPVWLKERTETNPIKDSLSDKNQPFWWRKVVGPAVDRVNDSLPEDRRTETHDDLRRIPYRNWCRFRRDDDCWFPREMDEAATEQAGYAVWVPFNRGACPWKTRDAQKHSCRVSEPGPDSHERHTFPDATRSWAEGGQRTSSIVDVPVSISRTAKWVDVRNKAKRIRQEGGVRIIAVAGDTITGEVKGDTGLYTATVTLVPGTSQVGIATCSCPWETYRWMRSGPWKKYEGRACAHITALLFEMQSRKMFGGEVTEDAATPEWRTEQPALEPERSLPGEWRTDRAAVRAAVEAHLASVRSHLARLDAQAVQRPDLDAQVASLAMAEASLGADDGVLGDRAALISLGVLTAEARSLTDVPPFYAQVSGEIVVVDGFDDDGRAYANGTEIPLSRILYPTFHPTLGITGSFSVDAPPTIALKTASSTGAMVALVPSPGVAQALAAIASEAGLSAESPTQIHLTLAYLGKAAALDRATFLGAVQGIAAAAGPLVGKVSGWGTFNNSDEHVLWASTDIPGVDVLRSMVTAGLVAAGIEPSFTHGFTPHITVAYGDAPIESLPISREFPLSFSAIAAVFADEWTHFDLGAADGAPIASEMRTAAAMWPEKIQDDKGFVVVDPTNGRGIGWYATYEEAEDALRDVAMGIGKILRSDEYRMGWTGRVGVALASSLEVPEEVQAVIDEGDYTHAGLVIKALDSGRVLMTQRTPYHADDDETYGSWEFPGGLIEPGESAIDAALREFGEETGLALPEHTSIVGAMPKDSYVSILVCVPHESWTTSVELLPAETMGIGWFDPEHVEETPLTRPEVDETDWETVKEAASKAANKTLLYHHAAVQSVLGVDQLVTGNFQEVLSCGHRGKVLTHEVAHGLVEMIRTGATINRECSQCMARTEDVAWSEPSQPAVDLAQDYIDDGEVTASAELRIMGPDGQSALLAGVLDRDLPVVRSMMDGLDVDVVAGSARISPVLDVFGAAGVDLEAHDDFSDFMADVNHGDGGSSGRFPVQLIESPSGAEAILHDEPEPALPEAYGVLGDGVNDPDRFPGSPLVPSSTDGRTGPDDPWVVDPSAAEDRSADAPFTPGDPRLAYLADEGNPETDSADIAQAAMAFLAGVSKTALRDFSAYEQATLINEGEAEGRGARNLEDRLDIAGTHYELLADASPDGFDDEDWMGF